MSDVHLLLIGLFERQTQEERNLTYRKRNRVQFLKHNDRHDYELLPHCQRPARRAEDQTLQVSVTGRRRLSRTEGRTCTRKFHPEDRVGTNGDTRTEREGQDNYHDITAQEPEAVKSTPGSGFSLQGP